MSVEFGTGLTDRQQQVVTFMREFIAAHGYPPSLREIGAGVGLRSTSSVQHVLKQLQRKGHVRKQPETVRALMLRSPEPGWSVSLERVGGGAHLVVRRADGASATAFDAARIQRLIETNGGTA